MPKKKKTVNQKTEIKRGDPGKLLILIGLLIGMGIGFLVNQLIACLFIGLGAGALAAFIFYLGKK